MLCPRLIISSLVLLFWSSFVQVAVQDEAIATCKKNCIGKLGKEAKSQCTKACVELRNIAQELNISGNEENPSPPGIPRLVSSRFSSIRLSWNTTGIHNSTAVRYILEIDPNLKQSYLTTHVIVVYPDVEKYRLVNETVYTVERLLAKESYKFRVAAVTLNGSSFFSKWSNLTHTNGNCKQKSCHITNVRLVLTPYTEHEHKGSELKGIFRWELPTGLTEIHTGQSQIIVSGLSDERHCSDHFGKEPYTKYMEEEELTNKNRSFHQFVDSRAQLYFGCDYSVKIGRVFGASNTWIAVGSWKFHIPFCDSLLDVCGCKDPVHKFDKESVEANWIRRSENTSSVIVTWSTDQSWTNVTYYGIRIKIATYPYNKISYVYQKINIHKYNKTFSNLQNNRTYGIEIKAFDKNNCTFNEIKRLQFPDPTKLKPETTSDPLTNPTKLKPETTSDPLTNPTKLKPETTSDPLTRVSSIDYVPIVVPISVTITIVFIVMVGLFVRKQQQSRNAEINFLYIQRNIIQRIDHDKLNDGIELPQDRIEFGGVIGEGAFGKVYRGKAYGILGNTGWTTVALKRLRAVATCDEMDSFLDEIMLMKNLGKHKNVIQMHGCCTVTQPVCIIMEYASLGSLLDYLKSLKQKNNFEIIFYPAEDEILVGKSKEALILNDFVSFARQIANGMTYVADLGIVHRDLAARNILLDKNKVIKISDFGLSRGGNYVMKTRRKMPIRWLPIEAIQGRVYTTASDVWEFGVVLWEMYTLGDTPYPSVPDESLFEFLRNGKRMEKPGNCSDIIYDIMLKCWSSQPGARPKFHELHTTLMNLENRAHFYVNVNPPRSSLELQDIEKNNAKNQVKKPFENGSNDGVNGVDNTGFLNIDKTGDPQETNHIHAL